MKNGSNAPCNWQIVWSNQAEQQVRAVFDYLAENWTDKQIQNLTMQLEKTLANIQQQPKMYATIPDEFEVPVYRAVVLKLNSLFYSINETTQQITILALIDNRQNPQTVHSLLN